jgi:hypothetical protein
MSKELGNDTIQSIAGSATQQQNQLQVTIDDAQTATLYGSNVRLWNSNEELFVDVAGPLRPTGPKTATMKIEQRVILNPFAAKRLAMMLSQWVHQYEQTYGTVELDERRRRINPPPAGATSAPAPRA